MNRTPVGARKRSPEDLKGSVGTVLPVSLKVAQEIGSQRGLKAARIRVHVGLKRARERGLDELKGSMGSSVPVMSKGVPQQGRRGIKGAWERGRGV